MDALNGFFLGLGLGMSFGSKLYLLVFKSETCNELILYTIYIHLIPTAWLQMTIKYVSGST